ncbi:MAG: hypothetical protein BM556_12810 [Bacteriovorax sp. MedPE-SWde]|nr:MAG: hypothetical protein BM556_12810 [Bacteriovorax sp. MedPE-SWde]
MEKKITKTKFFIAKNGQDYGHLDANDLFVEVVAGNVFKDSFVFNEDEDRWVHLISHNDIPSKIKNEALFCPDKIEVPDFKPKDEIIIKEIGNVDLTIVDIIDDKLNQIDSKIVEINSNPGDTTNIEELKTELTDSFSQKINELESSIQTSLKSEITEVIEKSSIDNSTVEQVGHNLISLKNEIKNEIQEAKREAKEEKLPVDNSEIKGLFESFSEKLKSSNAEIDLSKLDKMETILSTLLEANKKLVETLEEKEKENQHTGATLTRVEKSLKSLDDKINDHGESSKSDQEKFDKLYVKYKNQVMENKVLKSKLDKAVTKMTILHKRVNEASVIAQQEERPKPTLEELVDAPVGEAAKIIEMSKAPAPARDENFEEVLGVDDLKNGKSFEVTNNAIWLIDNGEGVKGPYRFDEMLKLKSTRKVNFDSLIKKKGAGTWSSLSDCLELSAESKLISEDKENPENSVYLIERSEYRADVHELVNFSIDGNEHKGYLTNISLGGGFIEVTRFNEEEYIRDKKVTLYIDGAAFSEPIICNLAIKRTSKNRPKGFGFIFENNSEKNLEVLGQYIVDYINRDKTGRSAA